MGPAAKSAKTQGGSMATPATAKYLTIEWGKATFSRARDGYADERLDLSGLVRAGAPMTYEVDGATVQLQRPVLLYVRAEGGSPERNQRAEETMFKSDDLAVASRVVRFLRAEPAELPEHVRNELGDALPAVLLLDSNGFEVERLTGTSQAGALCRKVNKLYRATWDGSLSKLASKARSLSIEIDALNKKAALAKAEVDECQAALDEKKTNGNKRALEKAREAQNAADEALQAKVDARDELSLPPLARGFLKAIASSN